MSLSRVMGRIFMRLAGLSWRVRYVRSERFRTGRARGIPVLFAFWHGRQLPLIHTHRNEGINVLVSRNTDGQYVTNVLHSMGFNTVRGSSSRGGTDALMGMSKRLRAGQDCAITPDGPRGPKEEAKAGTALISRLGNRPVVPMGTSAWPAVRFSSWDGFVLPLPFARVVAVEGRPLHGMARGEDQERWISRLTGELDGVTAYADLLADPVSGLMAAFFRTLGRVARPLAWLALFTRSRTERLERAGKVPAVGTRPVWLHGSSLGELNGLLPYIEYMRDEGVPVYVTCFTPSGRRFIRDRKLDGGFLPLDSPGFVGRFLERVRPSALILAETELWPNTVMQALALRIPCVMVNGRLSEGSMRGYKPFSALVGRMLSCFSRVIARTAEDRDRFAELGVRGKVLGVSGDSKFLADGGEPPDEWREMLGVKKPVLVAGSTREGEEVTILEGCAEAGFFPVMVPRHLTRVDEVTELISAMGLRPVKWSDLQDGSQRELDFDALVADVHGVLARMYGIGDAAFVGGTLVPLGGHNVLEPLMRGVPLLVGPSYGNFRETVDDLVEKKAAWVFSDSAELADRLRMIRDMGPRRDDVLKTFGKLRESRLSGTFDVLYSSGILKRPEGMESDGEA